MRPAQRAARPRLGAGGRAAIYFVRHGETRWTAQGRYQGGSDIPLAPAGVCQARRAARSLLRHGVTAVVSSPLRRAVRTSAVIARCLGVGRPAIDRRLHELRFGSWEGLTQREVRARWPEQLREWKRTPDRFRFPEGETLARAQARLAAFLRTLRARRSNRSRPIVVVTHAGIIRLALLAAADLPLSQFRAFSIEPGGVVRFNLVAGGVPGARQRSALRRAGSQHFRSSRFSVDSMEHRERSK